MEGLEPPSGRPERPVLPLNDTPVATLTGLEPVTSALTGRRANPTALQGHLLRHPGRVEVAVRPLRVPVDSIPQPAVPVK
jgi:hypothetical protein